MALIGRLWSANDGSLNAGMQNTDIGLAPLVVVRPVCYVTDGTEPKMRSGPTAETGGGPDRVLGETESLVAGSAHSLAKI